MNNQKLAHEIEQLKQEIAEMKANRGISGFLKKSFSKMNVLVGVGMTVILTSMILWAAQITFTDGTIISANDVNSNFTELYNSFNNIAPIGTLLAWHKNFSNTPSLPEGWVECNGQLINDTKSPYNGQNAPDLNTELYANNLGYYLRGSSTSGNFNNSTKITDTSVAYSVSSGVYYGAGHLAVQNTEENTSGYLYSTSSDVEATIQVASMSVVWIIRIK